MIFNGFKGDVPIIQLTFGDGYEDLMKLRRFKPNSKDPKKCHFVGHLQNEPKACVSLVGCFGLDNMEMMIHSKHSSNFMFILHTNGTLESVESEFKVLKSY